MGCVELIKTEKCNGGLYFTDYFKETRYVREFQLIGEPKHCGYIFECDENGNILGSEYLAVQQENLEYALRHPEIYEDLGLEKREMEYTEKYLFCSNCGEKVYLTSFTNECECGNLYNSFGQELAPREQWGWCGDNEDDYY